MHGRQRIGEGEYEVAFDDQGQGPAVVMLHPFPFDGRAWQGNVEAIVDAGHRVVTLDYPGFGDSPPPRTPISISAMAGLVAELMDRLAIGHAALVGLSMGGYVALAFSRFFKQRLWGLVLADTRAAADSPAARQGRDQALRVIREQGVDAYLRQSLPRLLSEHAGADTLARATSLAEKREETLNAGIAALRDRPDRTDELSEISCATLVLVGAGDQVTPPAEMRAMAAAIPRAAFVELPAAGHLANLEAPHAFNQALVHFLRGAAASATGQQRAEAR